MVSGFLFVLCSRDNVNKTTVALSKRRYKEIIKTMKEGGTGFRPNTKIATALVLEANLGLRIEDILSLKLGDIIADGNRYRLNIVEKKTGKKRVFTVPKPIYKYLMFDFINIFYPFQSRQIITIFSYPYSKRYTNWLLLKNHKLK